MQKGIAIFGKQYEFGYKNETHAPGSVVRVLFDEMIKLDENSVEYYGKMSYNGSNKLLWFYVSTVGKLMLIIQERAELWRDKTNTEMGL